jgi:hypothetical protein
VTSVDEHALQYKLLEIAKFQASSTKQLIDNFQILEKELFDIIGVHPVGELRALKFVSVCSQLDGPLLDRLLIWPHRCSCGR